MSGKYRTLEQTFFPIEDEEERKKVDEFRLNYQNYRRGDARGAKGEFTSKTMRPVRDREETTRLFNTLVAIKVLLFNIGAALYQVGSIFFIETLFEGSPGLGGWFFVAGSALYTLGAAQDAFTAIVVLKGFRAAEAAHDKKARFRIIKRIAELGGLANAQQVHMNAGVLRPIVLEEDDVEDIDDDDDDERGGRRGGGGGGGRDLESGRGGGGGGGGGGGDGRDAALGPSFRIRVGRASIDETRDPTNKRLARLRAAEGHIEKHDAESTVDRSDAVQSVRIAVLYFFCCLVGFLVGSFFFVPPVYLAMNGAMGAPDGEDMSTRIGCWFFIVFSILFMVASGMDVWLLIKKAHTNSEPMPWSLLIVAACPLLGGFVWVVGSVLLLPEATDYVPLRFDSGPILFIIGSFAFQISAGVSAISVVQEFWALRRERSRRRMTLPPVAAEGSLRPIKSCPALQSLTTKGTIMGSINEDETTSAAAMMSQAGAGAGAGGGGGGGGGAGGGGGGHSRNPSRTPYRKGALARFISNLIDEDDSTDDESDADEGFGRRGRSGGGRRGGGGGGGGRGRGMDEMKERV